MRKCNGPGRWLWVCSAQSRWSRQLSCSVCCCFFFSYFLYFEATFHRGYKFSRVLSPRSPTIIPSPASPLLIRIYSTITIPGGPTSVDRRPLVPKSLLHPSVDKRGTHLACCASMHLWDVRLPGTLVRTSPSHSYSWLYSPSTS